MHSFTLPQSRQADLVVRDLAGETLIYDLRTHHAHSLNRSASVVWRACDGTRSEAELALELKRECGLAAELDLVRLALRDLGQAGLLQAPMPAGDRISRRELAQRLQLVGALVLLVPAVESIVAPQAADAASACSDKGESCLTKPCCPPLVCNFAGLCE